MKVAFVPRYGPPEVVSLREVPTPTPGRGQVRIAVLAAFQLQFREIAVEDPQLAAGLGQQAVEGKMVLAPGGHQFASHGA